MIRLGVAARLIGPSAPKPIQAGHDLTLLWLCQALRYLQIHEINCYRLPDLGDPSEYLRQSSHQQLLAELEGLITRHSMRISIHLSPALGPGMEQQEYAYQWAKQAEAAAMLLQALNGSNSVIVTHITGAVADRKRVLERAAYRIMQLPQWVQQYLVAEPDERCFDLWDLMQLYQVCGVPIIFDLLHHQIHNRQHIPVAQALALAFGTWPVGRRPKIHISTQRTEAHLVAGSKKSEVRIIAPKAGQHADFLNPFEVAEVFQIAHQFAEFDAMIEAKAADLALLRLREDLRQYRPAVAARVAGCQTEVCDVSSS